MIPKFWCWLFGHKFIMDVFTGKTEVLTDPLMGCGKIVGVFKKVEQLKCLRCNIKNPDVK